MSKNPPNKPNQPPRDQAKVERLFRRLFDGMGAALDRKLGRETVVATEGGMTTARLIERMRRLIDERVRQDRKLGRIAPHLLKLKIEWGTHSETPPAAIKDLEHEILAAAIDYINDARLRTLAPVRVETVADIFTTGITVDPTYGEFEEELARQDEAERRAKEGLAAPNAQGAPVPPVVPDVAVTARIRIGEDTREQKLSFKPGGRRINVGRSPDNDLQLNHGSVSKIHAALMMNREGTLLVADTGSTNGTYINGRRIAYGEARQIEEGDSVGFGDVEVRLKKQ
jgi:hypothetical protein